jgi:uncharacterized membrane protein YhhN
MSWIFIIAGLFAVLNWYAVTVTNKKIEYIAKTATLTILLIAYAARLPFPLGWWQVVFGAGLLFSLFGDVFLMLPSDQFVLGLLSFLLAQIAYIAVFNFGGLELNVATILMVIAIALIAIPVIGSIVSALRKTGRSRLVIPVMVYGLCLSLMFWSTAATLYRPEWSRFRRYSILPLGQHPGLGPIRKADQPCPSADNGNLPSCSICTYFWDLAALGFSIGKVIRSV